MSNHPADRIRNRLIEIAQQDADLMSIRESILIRGGMYCGRRFFLSGYSVIYFAEENQIKLFLPNGELGAASSVEEFCNWAGMKPSDQSGGLAA